MYLSPFAKQNQAEDWMSQSNQCLGSHVPLAMFVLEGGRILGWVTIARKSLLGN